MFQRRRDLPLAGDPASRFVPGIIGIMVFLSVLVLATALVLGNAIDRWRLSYSVQMTVEVPPSGTGNGAVQRVINVLSSTPGVIEARPLGEDKISELLAPWIGSDLDINQLPLPVLIDVRLSQPGAVDAEALQSVLEQDVPGIRVDDGRRWLDPVRSTAKALQMIAAMILVFIAAGTIATVVFMTRTGLAVHRDTIAILHQVGARDHYIARQFQGQALRLALYGGVPGLVFAVLCLILIGRLAGQLDAPLLPELTLGGHGWIALIAVPVLAAAIAMVTARLTVLATLARFVRRRRHIWMFRSVVAALFVLCLWLAGFIWFVVEVPDRPTDDADHTDAIVVLTGGADRLTVGLDLLDRELGDTLFISGVYTGVDVATILALNDQAPAKLACCIELGHSAQHTMGNAEETAAWMAEGDRTSLRLVTAAYHMPRSLALFRRLMPDTKIVPHPVFPESVDLSSWWHDWGTFSLLAGEYSKFLVSKVWPG